MFDQYEIHWPTKNSLFSTIYQFTQMFSKIQVDDVRRTCTKFIMKKKLILKYA